MSNRLESMIEEWEQPLSISLSRANSGAPMHLTFSVENRRVRMPLSIEQVRSILVDGSYFSATHPEKAK